MAKKVPIDKQTVTPKFESVAIMSDANKDQDRIRNVLYEGFYETKPLKRNMLIYRSQYQGIDPIGERLTSLEPGDPLQSDLPGVTSMMLHKLCNIVAARYHDTFMSEHGDHIIGMPQHATSVVAARNATYLGNYYLRQDRDFKDTFREACWGTTINGAWVLRNFWNYKTQAIDTPRRPQLKLDKKTNTLQLVPGRYERTTKILCDRPQIAGIDPLFFALPKGCNKVNGDMGSPFTFEKRLFYRWELVELENQGYIDGFKDMRPSSIGSDHTNGSEPSEMRDFYDELFDTKMNEGLDDHDLMYRYFVDIIFESGTPTQPVYEHWIINGHVIRSATWTGGINKPYEVLNYIPTLSSWVGMSVPEIAQDHFREFNLMYKLSIQKARRSGNTMLMTPEEANVSQKEANKASNNGGIVKYSASQLAQLGFSPKDMLIPVELEGNSANLLDARTFIQSQAMEDVGVSPMENAGGVLEPNYRSASMIKGLGMTGSKPSKMVNSVFGSGLQRVYENFKYMMYTLQTEPIQDYINPVNSEIFTVSSDDLCRLPDVIFMPNANTDKLTPQMFTGVMQQLPVLQQIPGFDMNKFVKFVFGLGFSTEIARQLEQIIPDQPPMPPMMPGMGNPQTPNLTQPQGAPSVANQI